MTRQDILEALKDGPKIIYGGMPRGIYFELQHRGLITMTAIRVDSQETAVEVRLVKKGETA